MSHPSTTTDFDKYGTFKITSTNTVKRANESHHDDESKKLRLEKSGSSSNILATNAAVSVNTGQATNSVIIGSATDSNTKKLKTRKIFSGDGGSSASTSTQHYQLIVEDGSAGAFSEESCGGGETSGKTYSTGGGGDSIHLEGDPGGTTAAGTTTYLTAVSTKAPPPKRLQIGMAEAKKSLGDSIDLKLITTSGEAQATGKFSVMTAATTGDKKPEQQILLAASSSTSINPQNTFTYSRVRSVSNVTGPGGESVNLKSLQGTVKNQSLVVSSKKLLPEGTQTTAKVSIGNTTISVPLLKPLNSTQIIQAGGSNSSQSGQSDGAKSVIHTIQTSSSQLPQTQLSKILNIKRGQKVSQPTFVSLSQLQIKPVSSKKIVQAKVVSKIPLHIQAVQTNKSTLLQQTSGVVTITSTKPELQGQQSQQQATLQGHLLQSPQKKQQLSFVKDLPGAIIKTTSNAEEFHSSSSHATPTGSSDQPTLTTAMVNSDKSQLVKSSTGGGSNTDSSAPSIIATEFLPAGVKVVSTASHLNSANLRPSLSSQLDSMDQGQAQTPHTPQRINICPTISIVRQNSPQLVTTSGNLSTVSLSMAESVSGQQKLILTKPQFANVSSANITTSGANTVTANFPRNISLMLAKTSAGQQVFTNAGTKTTLCVTTAVNNNPNKANAPARMHLSINPNVLSSTASSTSSSLSTPMVAVATTGTHSEGGDSGTPTEGSAATQDASNVQQHHVQPAQQIQTNVVQNRKIIQVLPGGLYSSSGGSFMQITKAKAPDAQEEEKKKVGEMDQAPPSSQHQQVVHWSVGTENDDWKNKTYRKIQQSQQQQQRQQLIQHQHHLAATQPHPPKTEESNNVLLKQLLQNSNSTPINSQASSQNARGGSVGTTSALTARKANVRAPSLGVFSSLEAQLARPVIPPVPASDSNTHSAPAASTPPTTPSTQSTPQSQSQKITIDNTKASSTQPGHSPAPTPPHTSAVTTPTPTSVPSLILSSSKTLSQTSDKPKFSSSPLISKETSFVSKPTLPEHTEQNIEIFSLQSTGDSTTKSEQQQHQQQQSQQQFDHLTSPAPGQQIVNQSFKAFTHHNSSQGPITAKISKYVHDAKKASDHQQQQQIQHPQQQLQHSHAHPHSHQQQQQQLSVNRTYSSISNIVGNIKEKNSGNVNTHSIPQTAGTALSVSSNTNQQQQQQQQQQMMVGMQQQNKMFSTPNEASLPDNNSQAKVIEGQTSSMLQIQHQQNQVIIQQQQQQQQHIQSQDPTKAGASSSVKIEADEPNTLHQLHQQHQQHQQHQNQQMQHHQQQSLRQTTPSPMPTTPTNSVASTPTSECHPPINIINKQQILLQQQHQQQSQPQSTTSPSSGTSAPNSATKDGDNRKKRKREQQSKQRKQPAAAVNTKETAANSLASSSSASSAVNNKKRSRKSLKLEEDYDSFIDNLMMNLRQMPPLQVLEPELNVNYGVCNLYGWRNCTRSNNSSNSPPKESRQSERGNLFEQELEGEFGSAYIPHKVPFYDMKKFRGRKGNYDDMNTSSSIQNNYYDQEFPSFTYKSEPDKLNSWIKVYRERAVDTPEIVSNKLMMPVDPVKTMRFNMLQQESFPGLILMSNTQQRMGRMSPVIPLVNSMALITKRKKTPLKPLENDADNGICIKEHPDEMDCKAGLKNNVNSQNVILSLPTSSAERLLDVLKNLANLLQINTPIPYKVVDDVDSELDEKPASLLASERELVLKNLSIQDILNGRSKMCRQCGKAIKGRCLKNNNDNTKSPLHDKLLHPPQPRYFCNKVCYIHFRWNSEKKPLSVSSLKSVLATRGGSQNESDDLMDSLLDIKPDITTLLDEKKETNVPEEKTPAEPPVAKAKKVCFRYYNTKCFEPSTPVKRMSEKEIRDMLFKMDITVSVTTAQVNTTEPGGAQQMPIEDRRTCVLCSQVGDGVADGPSRLLNYDVDKWVHLNCALWSSDVYETISGGLMNFQMALQIGLNQTCNTCHQLGATVKCYKTRCGAVFHLPCAIRDQCVFYQNKTIHCHAHANRNDKDKELLTLSVPRRVYVERDENRQVAAIMHHSEMVNLLRIGSLIFLNVGQLLPHQLDAFHTPNYIYPIGYKIIRFYWSMRRPNKRCRYVCSIAEVAGRPEFRIVVQEPGDADVELRDVSPKAVWQRVLQPVAEMRRSHNLVKLYPEFISGEDLFGLTEPAIVRIIESLPGIETLTSYRFKYGRNPLLDLPLALNPSGAARTEPKLRQLMGWKKHHPQRTCSTVSMMGGHQAAAPSVAAAGEVTCPYSKQFVHSKSSQYKKMKQEWRNNVYLARSKIAGLGLYAARDMEKHTMIIEYIGEVIRTEVSEIREKQYEARNRGIYMFRLDEDRVVDATLCGGLARYINHSCNPNCVTEIVEVDRELRIIIFAKRRINRSEELSYDYKFDIEDDGSKIPCMCGAPNCRKWMN